MTPEPDFLSPLAHLRADPRASSTHSLVPSEPDRDAAGRPSAGRRRLLLVYVHGFYGNDQSFHSFPAHVHSFLREALADTHVIHSKIYPRYKTYRAVGVGAENFSQWLEPHEDEGTDVVLVGHSMGGILAAEVVLTVSESAVRCLCSGEPSLDGDVTVADTWTNLYSQTRIRSNRTLTSIGS